MERAKVVATSECHWKTIDINQWHETLKDLRIKSRQDMIHPIQISADRSKVYYVYFMLSKSPPPINQPDDIPAKPSISVRGHVGISKRPGEKVREHNQDTSIDSIQKGAPYWRLIIMVGGFPTRMAAKKFRRSCLSTCNGMIDRLHYLYNAKSDRRWILIP